VPIVLGAGPAGCAAAICLARGGAAPTLIDRDAEVGDALCGGFMSWRTVAALGELGLDAQALGAHRVDRLVLHADQTRAEAALPEPAWGLSRHALDSALRQRALAAGARLEIDRARRLVQGVIEGERREWRGGAVFLATGKLDVRGDGRPRAAEDPALGLRIRIPAQPRLAELLAGTIELHFFDHGYAGIVLQEDGSANVCLALRKSLLAEAGGSPRALLDRLADRHPAFGERMAFAGADLPVDTVGSVPYGWIARDTVAGLYRVGDQAAVIPSLAGEGMGIALASGRAAAEAYFAGKSACEYQRAFARRARRPVAVAHLVWSLAERPATGVGLARLASAVPRLADLAMRLSRI
jgi:flavin-dependent dehydrogenase